MKNEIKKRHEKVLNKIEQLNEEIKICQRCGKESTSPNFSSSEDFIEGGWVHCRKCRKFFKDNVKDFLEVTDYLGIKLPYSYAGFEDNKMGVKNEMYT